MILLHILGVIPAARIIMTVSLFSTGQLMVKSSSWTSVTLDICVILEPPSCNLQLTDSLLQFPPR